MQNTAQETAMTDAAQLIAQLELPYLQQLQAVLSKHIDGRRQQTIADAKIQIRKIAEEHGLSLASLLELVEQKERKPYKPQAAPTAQYRNPADPTVTWSGRGRQPQWIKNELAKGRHLGDFAEAVA
ncbi:MAG: H-NS histone family protein [Telluria sp.]